MLYLRSLLHSVFFSFVNLRLEYFFCFLFSLTNCNILGDRILFNKRLIVKRVPKFTFHLDREKSFLIYIGQNTLSYLEIKDDYVYLQEVWIVWSFSGYFRIKLIKGLSLNLSYVVDL